MSRQPRLSTSGAKLRRIAWTLCALFLLAIAGGWWLLLNTLAEEEARTRAQAFERVTSMTSAFEEHTKGVLNQVDLVTRFVAYNAQRGISDLDLAALTREANWPSGGLLAIHVANAKGDVVASSLPNARANIADREHFNVHVDGSFRGMFISKPVVGRVSKRPVVQMSRRIADDSGRFSGVVIISADPAYFTNFYNEAQFGRKGVLSLVGLDWVVRGRRSGDNVWFGDVAGNNFLSKEVAKASKGTYAAGSKLDGVPRLLAYKVLDAYPFVVFTGLAEEEVFASWKQKRREVYAWMAAGTAVVLLGSLVVLLLLRRLGASEHQAMDARMLFEAASDASLDAFFILKALRSEDGKIVDFVFVHCNERGAALVAMDKASILGKRLCETFPINREPRFFDAYCQVVDSRRPLEEEFCLDQGAVVKLWLHHQVVPVDDGIAITARDVSAARLRQAEIDASQQALAAAEKRLRAIANNLPALIAYIDRDERYQFANAYYKTVFGVEPESLIGHTIAEALGPKAREDLAKEIEGVLRGERRRFERHGTEGGIEIHFLVDYVPELGPDGTVVGFYVLVLDITDRKKVEQRLIAAEERTRSVIEGAPDAFVSIDAQGHIDGWNRQAEQTFGWSRDQVIGRPLAEVLIPQEQRPAHHAGFMRFVASGTGPVINSRLEVEALHRDGSRIPVEMSVAAVRSGDRYSAIAFLHDISERKAAETQLVSSEQRLQDVLNSIPAMVGYFDAEQRCQFANEAALRSQSIDQESAIGSGLKVILGHSNYAQHAPYVEKALAGERVRFEGSVPHQGRSAHFQAHLVPDRAGRGFYLMTFDVTRLKEAELRSEASERRLRAITDNVPALISHLDHEGRYLFANQQFHDLANIDPAALIGRTLEESREEAYLQQIRPHVKLALSGKKVDFESTLELDGETRHYRQSYVPDVGPSGRVAGFFSVTFDITDQVMRQAALQASERRLRDITDNLPVLISYINAEQRLTFLNRTFKEWTGTDMGEALGKPLIDVLGHELYEARKQHLQTALDGRRVSFEDEYATPGGLRHLQTEYVPDLRTDGTVAGIYTLTADISEMKAAEQKLAELVRTDSLTGLPNRRHFNEQLDHAVGRHVRVGDSMAVLFLDIDRFKGINDSLGHAAGDLVLQEFASRLKQSLRAIDTVARLAGDEFVVILERLGSPEEAKTVAGKILTVINRPFDLDGRVLDVGTSIGIAFRDDGLITPAQLLDLADRALYAAKDAGRNGFHLLMSSAA